MIEHRTVRDPRGEKLRELAEGHICELAEETADNSASIEDCISAIIELAEIIGGEE